MIDQLCLGSCRDQDRWCKENGGEKWGLLFTFFIFIFFFGDEFRIENK